MSTTTLRVPAGWVTAKDSGFSTTTLAYWRAAEWLKEAADCQQVEAPRGGRHGNPEQWIYRRKSLEAASKKATASRPEKVRTKWRATERITVDGEGFVRRKVALEVLGVSKKTLFRWTNGKCEHLGGGSLRTIRRQVSGDRWAQFWSLRELTRVRLIRKGTPRVTTEEDVYTLAKTIELTGIPEGRLRRMKERHHPLGLEARYKRVLAARRPTGWAERMRNQLAFTRQSVDSYLSRVGRPCIPPGKMTSDQAADELKVSRPTVCRWVKDGLLRGEGGCRTRIGVRPALLIEKASVNEAKEVMRTVDNRLRLRAALEAVNAEPAPATINGGPVAGQAPAQPVATGAGQGREYQSSAEWAAELGMRPKAVETKLRRLRIRGKIRALKNPDRRMNEPEYLYPRSEVLRHMNPPCTADAR